MTVLEIFLALWLFSAVSNAIETKNDLENIYEINSSSICGDYVEETGEYVEVDCDTWAKANYETTN